MKHCSVLVSVVLLAVAGWGLAPHGPAPHGPVLHGPVLHDPALHGPAPHGPALHDPVLHDPALYDPALHDPVLHGPALHDPAAGDARPKVACFRRRIRAVFRPLVRTNLHVKDGSGAKIPVPREEGPCGVRKWREKDGRVSFYSQYDGCYVRIQGGALVVPLAVQLAGDDRWIGVNISCPQTRRHARPPQPTPTMLPESCDLAPAMRMPCGPPAVSMETCGVLGCCFSSQEDVCYYRLNACSVDGHFVFSVAATDAEPPLDPRTLGVRGHPGCLPAVATPDVAVFKIHTSACGARMRLKGGGRSYEVEVEALATDRSPFSLQVQCEYPAPQPGAAGHSAAIMTTPTPLVAMGTIGVQMRIATDSSFSSFLSGDQLPAAFPLRSPVHVEVSLLPPAPEPGLSLQVGDCFAYPASRTSAWRLLHHGCPDALDPLRSTAPVDALGGAGAPSQVRRFDVKTFAFLDPRTGAPSEEEIYFYCWVEVCPAGADCVRPCTVASSEAGRRRRRRRRRREVRSDLAQLVSVGPLLLNPETHGPIRPTGESCCHRPHTDP